MKHFALVVGLLTIASLAAEPASNHGLLVFPDHNQVTGTLMSDGVFASDRFGEIHFKPDEARFVPDARPAPEANASGPSHTLEAKNEQVAPPVATATSGAPAEKQAGSFPWKISVSGYLDHTVEGGDKKQEYIINLTLNRAKTAGNEINSRLVYEYAFKGGRIDKRKATSELEWRHDLFETPWFSLTRSYGEYDGTNLTAEETAAFGSYRVNYLLGQQQVGLGYHLLGQPLLSSNVAFTWSWFYIDVFHVVSGNADAPSFIIENNLKLPWSLELKQRGQTYFLRSSDTFGWENRFDLTRQLTPHLFLTLRHEYRHKYPVLNANAINRVRLLFGAEF